MASVIHGDRRADTGSHLGKIQTDTGRFTNPVVRFSHHVVQVDASTTGMVGDQSTQWIVHQPSNPAGAQPKPGQGIGHVIFAAANPDFQ